MKVLLTTMNAKFIHSCLALYALKAFCPMFESHISIREFTVNQERDFILREIVQENPALIGFSCYIWNITQTIALVKTLKNVLPDVIVVFGGPEVSFQPEEIFSACPLDVIVQGEGEQTFLELLLHYVDGHGSLDQIWGAAYRSNAADIAGGIVVNNVREVMEPSRIHFPYQNGLEAFENRLIYYETARGCPFHCQYCLSGDRGGVRLLPLERAYTELALFLEWRARQVKFVDRTFNCVKKHAMGIWQYLIEHDNGISRFHFEIAGDLLDDEEFELLAHARPGFFQFEIGVQSTNPLIIQRVQRATNLDNLFENITTLRKMGNIHLHLDLIAGLPGEDYASCKTSFNDVYRLGADQIQLGFLKLLKGAGLRDRAEQYGLVYDAAPPYEVLLTRQISFEELSRLKMIEEMTAVFYNSSLFVYTLRYLTEQFSTPFDFYEALSAYWVRNGYHRFSHSKFALFEILAAFDNQKEIVLNLLKFDLFLHEREKSPPEWLVPHMNPEKKQRLKAILYARYPDKAGKDLASSYHIEEFSFDISAWICGGKMQKRGITLIFDYENGGFTECA
ncbi:MAG: B12-binding domain-containing radical SAM protein [Clostridiales bacterium]|jgi:radical SAM superfamily enzyme YgiQ (UPF0313 family)|nr:B12-binding domain-containing radical SAM protein [Clostridiales bacterium]